MDEKLTKNCSLPTALAPSMSIIATWNPVDILILGYMIAGLINPVRINSDPVVTPLICVMLYRLIRVLLITFMVTLLVMEPFDVVVIMVDFIVGITWEFVRYSTF